MSKPKHLFSKADYDGLVKNIHEIAKMLENSNRDAIESTQESSETWHDNWRFEEGIRQSRMLSKQIEELKNIFSSAKIVSQPDNETLLGYKVEFEQGSKKKRVIIGSYFSYSNTPEIISYTSPIAQAIRNHNPGEQVAVENIRQGNIQILSIEPFEDYFKEF